MFSAKREMTYHRISSIVKRHILRATHIQVSFSQIPVTIGLVGHIKEFVIIGIGQAANINVLTTI